MNILIIDDEASIRKTTALALEKQGHTVDDVDGAQVALLKLKEEKYDLAFLDMRLGDDDGLEVLAEMQKWFKNVGVVVFTAHATVSSAVEAMKLGAFDYLEKPFTPDQLRLILSQFEKSRKLTQKVVELEEQVSTHNPSPSYQSADPSMQSVYDVLFKAAPTQASVLILGESGTGKSMVAREVHDRSHLKDKPFVTVSCPSLSRELLESDLFGHVKGAFTGAVKDTWGKVAAAKGGTLFLDEIGELPMEIQPKLLRLLQERQYERLGENKTRTAEVRVIAATNRNLEECVAEGTFREDLLYRLDVISVTMPGLRQRPQDLEALANHFLQFFADQLGRKVKGFSKEATELVLKYPWPGNIRELRNAVERSLILSSGDEVDAVSLPDSIQNGTTGAKDLAPEIGSMITLEELEKVHIQRVVNASSNLDTAAKTLGIDPATLYRKRKKMEAEAA